MNQTEAEPPGDRPLSQGESSSTRSEPDDPRVTRALEEYLAASSAGRKPDRRSFLAQHPEIAGELAECLEGLEFLHGAASRLQRPAIDEPALACSPSSELSPTTALGDYRLLREIGRGGMGVVYEAEQLSLGRRVALKVLPFAAALDSKQLQRFKNEALAAAHLHHTNIVPVYAVGYERGVHYYVMQYIEGQTLAAVIQELRQLAGLEAAPESPRMATPDIRVSPAARGQGASAQPGMADARSNDPTPTKPTLAASLSTERSTKRPGFFRTVAQLGVQAAEALEHAHQQGVVHRDIKPANLLVDGRAHLWITDFGLAQMQTDTRLTRTGDLVGTLRYMSPEQALAKRVLVDQRTDIYSLGVTLYEFLTLEPACTGRDRQEVLRQIELEEPRAPRRLDPTIPADLETIVLKAMTKEVEGRYATALELADDLRRFLEDRPIKAKKPNLVHRTARWARRHKGVVTSAVVVLVLAVVALAVSTVLISVERGKTVKQRDAARRAVDEMYTQVAQKWLEQEPEMEEVQREFLLKALDFYEEFAKEQGASPAIRFATARAYHRAGDIHQKLGQSAHAEPAYAQAICLYSRLAEDLPAQPEYRAALAQGYGNLGALLLPMKRHEEAEKANRQAVALREQLLRDDPASAQFRYDLAVSLAELGRVLQGRGRSPDAEQAYVRALTLLNDLGEQLSGDAAYRSQLGALLCQLAGLQGGRGNWTRDLQLLRQGIDHQRNALKLQPRHLAYRKHLGSQLTYLGHVLIQVKELAEAEVAYQQALALQQKLADDFPRVPHYRRELADTHQDLGELLFASGRTQEAGKAYGQALALREQLAQEFPTAAGYLRDLSWLLATCPDLRFRNPERAVTFAQRAVEQAPQGGDCWRTLGVASYRAGDWKSAVTALARAMEFRSGGDSIEWFFLAMAYRQLGEKGQARTWYDQAVQWMEKHEFAGEQLRRLHAEATASLGLPGRPTTKEEQRLPQKDSDQR